MSGLPDRCNESIMRGFRGGRCGRTIKAEGLCGIHLAAKRKRDERDKAYSEHRTKQDEIAGLIGALATETGLPLTPERVFNVGLTGNVVVPYNVLVDLIRKAGK